MLRLALQNLVPRAHLGLWGCLLLSACRGGSIVPASVATSTADGAPAPTGALPPTGPVVSTVDPNDLLGAPGCWSVSTTYAAGATPTGTLKRSSQLTGPVPTHTWWTSALWDYPAMGATDQAKPFSLAMYALPLSGRTAATGLALSYVSTAGTTNDHSAFMYALPATPSVTDMVIGVPQMAEAGSQVDAASDWAVSVIWPKSSLRATLVKGAPYTYFETGTAAAQVNITGDAANTPTVWANANAAVGLTVNGRHYGLFAPLGSTWQVAPGNRSLTNDLGGRGYFSVAALPANTAEALAFYQSHAYAFVTGTAAAWAYDPASSTVTTTFTASVDPKEPSLSAEPLMGLFPHQAKYSSATLTPYTYASPRGTLAVFAGHTFTTQMRFTGVLPALPMTANIDANRLLGYIKAEPATAGAIAMGDTYGSGVAMNKYGQMALLADAAGATALRDTLLGLVRTSLTDWFNAAGDAPPLYAYNAAWTTIVGFPAGFGSDTQLNDHHFHWGYHIKMAALMALYDSAWGQDTGYGGMVKALVRDCANPVRQDRAFPFLRQFDVYEGHSWASGHANLSRAITKSHRRSR